MPRLPEGLKNLLKLADFLDRLPPERFDYGVWTGDPEVIPSEPEKKRGTTACALGWACSVPEIANKGLAFTNHSTYHGESPWYRIALNGKVGDEFVIASDVFGIPYDDANELFAPDAPDDLDEVVYEPEDDPTYVAMKIRNYVEAVRP